MIFMTFFIIMKKKFIIINIYDQTGLYQCILFNSTNFQLPILFYYRNRVTQTQMPVKLESSHVTRFAHNLKASKNIQTDYFIILNYRLETKS